MDPSVTNTIIFLNVGSIEADREIVISGHFYKDKKRLKCKLKLKTGIYYIVLENVLPL